MRTALIPFIELVNELAHSIGTNRPGRLQIRWPWFCTLNMHAIREFTGDDRDEVHSLRLSRSALSAPLGIGDVRFKRISITLDAPACVRPLPSVTAIKVENNAFKIGGDDTHNHYSFPRLASEVAHV